MYFSNLQELKQQLRSGRVTESSAFNYFLVALILDTLLIASWGMVPLASDVGVLDYIDMAGYFLIVVTGTVLLYRRNGGKNGQKFFVRYFPLLWVVGIRFLLVCVPLAVMYMFFAFSPREEAESGKWHETAVYLFVMGLYYWRLYVHVGDVADAERA